MYTYTLHWYVKALSVSVRENREESDRARSAATHRHRDRACLHSSSVARLAAQRLVADEPDEKADERRAAGEAEHARDEQRLPEESRDGRLEDHQEHLYM